MFSNNYWGDENLLCFPPSSLLVSSSESFSLENRNLLSQGRPQKDGKTLIMFPSANRSLWQISYSYRQSNLKPYLRLLFPAHGSQFPARHFMTVVRLMHSTQSRNTPLPSLLNKYLQNNDRLSFFRLCCYGCRKSHAFNFCFSMQISFFAHETEGILVI